MNLIAQNNLTMSSLEIADLVEKRHDNVKRTIDMLVSKSVIRAPQIEEVAYTNNFGATATREEYIFIGDSGKRDSIVVVAQLSPEFTARLVDRWQELEAQKSMPILPDFNNPIEAARAWADAKESAQIAEKLLIENTPKIEFAERYERSDGEYGFRQACKHLGANESEFRSFLLNKEIMYYLGGRLVPYAQHTHAGRFKFVVEFDSGTKTHSAPKFTPKGISWISELWRKRNAPKIKADRQQLLNLIEDIKGGVLQ